MMRSWGATTLSGTAVPVFGDVLTAAFTPGRRGDKQILTVASTTRYLQGDRIILNAGQVPSNAIMVDAIVDATHLQGRSEGDAALSAWPSGTLIMLSISCAQVIVQGLSNTAPIVLGTDNTVTTAYGGTAFGSAPVGGFYNYGTPVGNLIRTSELWMTGSSGDKAGVVALVI